MACLQKSLSRLTRLYRYDLVVPRALPSESYTQRLNLPAPPVRIESPVRPRRAAFPGSCSATCCVRNRFCRQHRGPGCCSAASTGGEGGGGGTTSWEQQLLGPTAAQRCWAAPVMEELCHAPPPRKAPSAARHSSFGQLFLFFFFLLFTLAHKRPKWAATANNKTKLRKINP